MDQITVVNSVDYSHMYFEDCANQEGFSCSYSSKNPCGKLRAKKETREDVMTVF